MNSKECTVLGGTNKPYRDAIAQSEVETAVGALAMDLSNASSGDGDRSRYLHVVEFTFARYGDSFQMLSIEQREALKEIACETGIDGMAELVCGHIEASQEAQSAALKQARSDALRWEFARDPEELQDPVERQTYYPAAA